MIRYEPAWLLFASDSDLLGLSGAAAILIAMLAGIMERRRHNRDRISAPDRVGWMPWTMISVAGAVVGLGLIAAALAG